MKSLSSFLLVLVMTCVFTACQKELSFDLNQPSSGTLKSDDLGDCLPSAVKGLYVVDAVLTADNFIEVTINVGTPGIYTVLSDTLNGYSFFGTGTAANIGLQTIKLPATGTPLAAGTDIFTIGYNNSFCKIPVTVVNSVNYFPLTQNSWWSYDVNIPAFPGDSLLVQSNNNILINGNNYRIFQNGPDETVSDSSYYIKTGNEYYQRLDASDFTFGVGFDQPLDTVIMFFNEALNAGTSWASEFEGTIGNQPSTIRYTYTLQEVNGSLDVNGVQFENVHKVTLVTETNINNGGYVEDANFEFFYAAGVGLIRAKGWPAADPNDVLQQDIKNYEVL